MQTEKEFLSGYSTKDYERPSVTADAAAFMIRNSPDGNYRRDPKGKISILLIRRGRHPFMDCWALPGGFLQPGETIEQCAMREITEETGVTPAVLLPVGIYSESGRDPRGWIISAAFASIISSDHVDEKGGDDASDAKWFDIDFSSDENGSDILTLTSGEIILRAEVIPTETRFGKTSFKIKESGGLAFDHARIISEAFSALRSTVRSFDTVFDFLPDKFTLSELQRVRETVMNISELPANFRRKAMSYVEETDEFTSGAGHRPARLYRKKN